MECPECYENSVVFTLGGNVCKLCGWSEKEQHETDQAKDEMAEQTEFLHRLNEVN